VVTTIIDVVVIMMGIIVLAILFRAYIAILISIVKVHSDKIIRKIKVSISMLERNYKRSHNQKSDRSSAQMPMGK
jgi:hypothetical protein